MYISVLSVALVFLLPYLILFFNSDEKVNSFES